MSDQLPDSMLDWEGLRKKVEATGGIRNHSITVTREDVIGRNDLTMSNVSAGIYPIRESSLPANAYLTEKKRYYEHFWDKGEINEN